MSPQIRAGAITAGIPILIGILIFIGFTDMQLFEYIIMGASFLVMGGAALALLGCVMLGIYDSLVDTFKRQDKNKKRRAEEAAAIEQGKAATYDVSGAYVAGGIPKYSSYRYEEYTRNKRNSW